MVVIREMFGQKESLVLFPLLQIIQSTKYMYFRD